MPAVRAANTHKGGCCCSARPAGGACQPGAVQTAKVMTRHRNACAKQASVTDTTRGNRNKTVMPPSVPWSTTASTAPRASQRTQRRDSHWVSSTISATVSKPTNAATRRCPCSNRTPPTIGGNTCPKDNGQSGTAKPEPVLVTNAPTKIKTSVAPAVTTAKRCTHTGHTAYPFQLSLMSPAPRGDFETTALRQPVLRDLWRTEFVRPPIDHGRSEEITVRRWRRRIPLQSIRSPGIFCSPRASKQRPDKVDHKENLRRPQAQCRHGDKRVHAIERLQELIVHGVVDAPHMTAHPQEVHREEGQVEEHEGEPEVNFSQLFVHHAAKYLGKPEEIGRAHV